MENRTLILYIFIQLVVWFTDFAESKIITVPFDQEDCPCEDRVVLTEGMRWEVDDEGRTVVNGYGSITKPIYEPISAETKVEQKRRGKWRFFLHQNFDDYCANIFEEDKPYAFLVKYVPADLIKCPIRPEILGNVTLHNVVYEGNVEKFIKLTPSDVGSYRMHITGTGKVDNKIKQIVCVIVYFDIVEVED